MRQLITLLLLGLSLGVAAASDSCEGVLEASRQQIEVVRSHTESIAASLQELRGALELAGQRNQLQARRIEMLEAELRELRSRNPDELAAVRVGFFARVGSDLPPSLVYQIDADRIRIAADAVFVFGTGQIGAEGQDRLAALVRAIQGAVADLPADRAWRLRVEGHTDSRPLRRNPHFASNWELSTARALAMTQVLVAGGIPPERLESVGLADTVLLDPGTSKASHRQNRRIEIHLIPATD